MALALYFCLALCLSTAAHGYNIIININSFPSSLFNTRWNGWAEARAFCDGVMAIGVANRQAGEVPMTNEDKTKILSLFRHKMKLVNTPWEAFQTYSTSDQGSTQSRFNSRYYKYPDINLRNKLGTQPSIFIWKTPVHMAAGESDRMLTTTDLGRVRASGLPPVYILASTTSKAPFYHPWCKGAVVEGAPQAWANDGEMSRWRFELGKTVLNAGKQLIVLSNSNIPGGDVTQHIKMLTRMMDNFFEQYGWNVMCGNRVTFAMSNYGNKLPYLPLRIPRTRIPAPSFAGGLLYMGMMRQTRCGNVRRVM